MRSRAGLVLAALLVSLPVNAGTLTVEVLDVGQGDSILIETPAKKTILIDAGDDPHRVRAMLARRGVDHLDLVIATHPHADHIGGMLDVVSQVSVKVFTDNGLTHTTATYRGLMGEVEQKKISYRAAVHGQRYNLDDGATLEILFPHGEALHGTRSDLNANSVVARLRHQGHCFLFTGDSEEPTERAMLGAGIGACDVLKVAHHGSDHSSTQPFLDAVNPSLALISVGLGNRYGHPGAATLARLTALGAKVYRTDVDGDIVVSSSEGALTVKTSPEPPFTRDAGAPTPRVLSAGAAATPALSAGPASTCPFVASAQSEVFHSMTCGVAKTIKKTTRCYQTREEALADGKRPAKCCHP